MAKPITMPQVGQNIDSAVILEWRVKENDSVQTGDILFVVESEKAVFEIEADEPGVILKLLCGEGETADVYDSIGYIGEPGECIDDMEDAEESAPHKGNQPKPPDDNIAKQPEESGRVVFASPSAKRVARKHGIDIAGIRGCGPDGRIVKQDVLDAVSPGIAARAVNKPAQPDVTTAESDKTGGESTDIAVELSGIRRRIADQLTLSKQTIPHFYIAVDADVSDVVSARREFNRQSEVRVSLNDIIIKSTADSLKKFPVMNSHMIDEKHILRNNVNIGIAVSVSEGLLVPVIYDADKKDLSEISRQSAELIQNADRGIVKARGMATFTISNMSMYRINYVLPIINPPECAILGIGGIQKRVVPKGRDGSTEVREMMTLTLSSDHRVIDGVYASRFLNTLKKILEKFSF